MAFYRDFFNGNMSGNCLKDLFSYLFYKLGCGGEEYYVRKIKAVQFQNDPNKNVF